MGSDLKTNSNIMNVFFNATDAGTFIGLDKCRTRVFWISDDFSYGNISNVEDYKTRIDARKKINFEVNCFCPLKDPNYYFEDESNSLKEKIQYLLNFDGDIRIWASKRDSNNLCGLYYLCNKLIDKDNLYLVKIDVFDSSKWWSLDVENYMCHNDLGELRLHNGSKEEKEFYEHFNDYIKLEHLNFEIRKEYSDIWLNLVKENKNIRLFEDGVIKSYYYRELYKDVFDLFDDEIYYHDLKFECLPKNNKRHFNHKQFDSLAYEMIQSGKLIVKEAKLVDDRIYHFLIEKDENDLSDLEKSLVLTLRELNISYKTIEAVMMFTLNNELAQNRMLGWIIKMKKDGNEISEQDVLQRLSEII